MSSYIIKEIKSVPEMLKYISVIRELSGPGLTEDDYREKLKAMIPFGYSQVGVFDDQRCIGLSGFWISTKLYSGKHLEMDNVVVLPAFRSKGIGKMLCDWCENKAKENSCKTLMLDAYLENEKAHKFYEREGYSKRGYHFIKQVW